MTRLTSASQVNPESYDAYINGKFHLNKITPEGFKIAQQYFELAVEIDPNNALAHVGVALVCGGFYLMGILPRQEAIPLRNEALEKALELDNTLAEAHATLAFNRAWLEWDWESAEKEYQQAFRLNPNDWEAHAYYSHLLCFMGRTEEAMSHIELALELDPINPTCHAFYGDVLLYHRRFDDAIAAVRTALDIQPNNGLALSVLTRALCVKGMHDEQLAIYRKWYSDDAELTTALEDGFEKAGNKGAFRAVADLMTNWYGKPGKSVRALDIYAHYLDAGDYGLAMDWLEKSYEDYDPSMPYLGLPYYDPLRSYPRFQDLLRKMNLPVDDKE
jgi:serine/threonine-protein kinase